MPVVIIPWLCFIIGCSAQNGNEVKEIGKKESKSGKISVTIDFKDQRPVISYEGVAIHEGMTILELMQQIEAAGEENEFRFEYRGAGETAFLKSILDVENEGGNGQNWIYDVDGKLGDCSFAAYKLKDGDTVHWKFKKYEEDQ